MSDYSSRQPLVFSRADLTTIFYVVTPDSTGVSSSPVGLVVGNGSGQIKNEGNGLYRWPGIALPRGIIKIYGQEFPEELIYDRNDASFDFLSTLIGNSANPLYPINTSGFALSKLIIAPYTAPPAVVPGPAPADAAMCLVEGYFEADTSVSFLLLPVKTAAKANRILVKKSFTVKTNEEGYFAHSVYRNDVIIPALTKWRIVSSAGDYNEDVYLDSAGFIIESLIT